MTDFTPTSKRLIIGSLGAIALTISIGWATGVITASAAITPLGMIITGFFTLLQGGK